MSPVFCRRRCRACLGADSLARAVFPLEEAGSNELCVFPQTHGATDEARDRDLIAYLHRIAAGQWSKIETEGR